MTGAPAKISRTAGERFAAFGGLLRRQTLLMVPNQLIVQAWRSSQWNAEDPDSILMLVFSKAARGGTIDLVHVNVPAPGHAGVVQGRPTYYSKPWRSYLAKKR